MPNSRTTSAPVDAPMNAFRRSVLSGSRRMVASLIGIPLHWVLLLMLLTLTNATFLWMYRVDVAALTIPGYPAYIGSIVTDRLTHRAYTCVKTIFSKKDSKCYQIYPALDAESAARVTSATDSRAESNLVDALMQNGPPNKELEEAARRFFNRLPPATR